MRKARGARSCGGAFEIEQFLFACEAPAVAGDGAALAEDAEAGDGDSEGVGGAGAGDGAGGARGAELLGDLGGGGGFAAGDFAELSPDALLEGGATYI